MNALVVGFLESSLLRHVLASKNEYFLLRLKERLTCHAVDSFCSDTIAIFGAVLFVGINHKNME